MASRDLHNNVHFASAIDPQTIATNTATAGAIIDTQGLRSIEFVIAAGSVTDGTYTPSLTEGDVANLSDGATPATTDLLGTIAGATFTSADASSCKKIGYRGSKRYVKLTLTSSSVTSGGKFAAVAVQGHPANGPTT